MKPRTTRRLLDHLLNDLPAGTLVTVIAGAGTGKSTLLSSWLLTSPIRSVVVTVDVRHDSVDALGRHLLNTVASVVPAASSLTASARGTHPDWVCDVLPGLVAALRQTPAIVMIDDVHALSNPDALELLRSFIDQQLRTNMVVLSGRHLPDVVPAGAHINRIGTRHLRLDGDAVALASGSMLTPTQGASLASLTGGWATAVQVVLSRMRREGLPPDALNALDVSAELSPYLEDEVFSEIDEPLLLTLASMAVLPDLSRAMLVAVFGPGVLNEPLTLLTRANIPLLVGRRASDPPVVLHTILKDALRGWLQRVDPQRFADITRRAADELLHDGRFYDAFATLKNLHQPELLMDLVADAGLKCALSGATKSVQRALDDIAHFVPVEPRLMLTQAAVLACEGDLAGMSAWLTQYVQAVHPTIKISDADATDALASVLAVEGSESGPLGLLANVLASVAVGASGAYAEASQMLLACRQGAQGYPFLEVIWAATIATMWARDGRVTDGRPLIDWAEAQVKQAGLTGNRMMVAVDVAACQYAMLSHNREKAEALLHTARMVLADIGHRMPLASMCWMATLSEVALWLDDAPTARALVADGRVWLDRFPEATAVAETFDEVQQAAKRRSRGDVMALTSAELAVLHHLASYWSVPRIAHELKVALPTVRTHVQNVYRKLGVHGRTEAVETARARGLLG